MSFGYFYLAAAILAYGLANFLQAFAVKRAPEHHRPGLHMFFLLFQRKSFVAGIVCQILGFLATFAARADLPLFLVQCSIAGGLGVTAIMGVVFMHWRFPRAELFLLIALGLGLIALIASAKVSESEEISTTFGVILTVAIGVFAVAGFAFSHLPGSMGAMVLGTIAGCGFGAAAIASRPLANADSLGQLLTDPMLYVVIAHSLTAQVTLSMAMHRGSITVAVGAMDTATAVPPAIVGLLLLGDQIEPGREWLALIGFIVTIGSMIGLTRYAHPQDSIPPAGGQSLNAPVLVHH